MKGASPMPAKKSSSKRSAARPMNKKAMKRTKGGLNFTAVATQTDGQFRMADGSVRPVTDTSTITVKL